MKKILLPTALFIALLFSSCSAIAGIFKAGMGVGIFVVLFVVIIIALVVMRINKK